MTRDAGPYNVVLLQFHRELLERLVTLLTDGLPEQAEVIRFGRHTVRRAPTPSRLPDTVLPYPEHLWLIVPAGATDPLPDRGEYHFARANSPERLHIFLAELSARHRWAILPWGGFLSDESLALVTREHELCRRAMADTVMPVQRWSTRDDQLVPASVDHLLSAWEVSSNLLDVARVALVEEYRSTGSRIWDLCGGPEGGLYVCAGPPDWPIEYGASDVGTPDPEDLDPLSEVTPETLAAEGGVEILDRVLENAVFYEGPRWLYRITRREPFLRMASRFRVVNGVAAQALPLTLSQDRVTGLLRDYLEDPSPTHVPFQMSLLDQAPWFWAAAECHMDVHYQHFATRDRQLLARFLTAPAEALGVISLF